MIQPFQYQKVHNCEAGVITCIDFRFWEIAAKVINEHFGINDFDFFCLPGGVKSLNDSDTNAYVAKCLAVSVDLHKVKKLIFINHADCGAYGGTTKHASPEAEAEFHAAELKKARNKIAELFPHVEVILLYAKLINENKDVEIIKVV